MQAIFSLILFSGDHIRRAAEKMRESRSSDFYTLARLALQGALRTKEDLIALLDEGEPDNTKARRSRRSLSHNCS